MDMNLRACSPTTMPTAMTWWSFASACQPTDSLVPTLCVGTPSWDALRRVCGGERAPGLRRDAERPRVRSPRRAWERGQARSGLNSQHAVVTAIGDVETPIRMNVDAMRLIQFGKQR